MGVGSASKGTGVMVYNKQEQYSNWEFIAQLQQRTTPGAGGGGAGGGTNGGANGGRNYPWPAEVLLQAAEVTAPGGGGAAPGGSGRTR